MCRERELEEGERRDTGDRHERRDSRGAGDRDRWAGCCEAVAGSEARQAFPAGIVLFVTAGAAAWAAVFRIDPTNCPQAALELTPESAPTPPHPTPPSHRASSRDYVRRDRSRERGDYRRSRSDRGDERDGRKRDRSRSRDRYDNDSKRRRERDL